MMAPALDELSNHTIKDASILQDKDVIQVAVVVYALAKIIHRSESSPELWKDISKKVIIDLENARFALEKNKEDIYKSAIRNMLKQIGKIDDKLKLYIDDVLDKARVVKGSGMYEAGVSIGRAAELLGISQWELMSYIGKTKIIERAKEFMDVINRLDFARSLFL